MAHYRVKFPASERICRAGAVALALAVGFSAFPGGLLAQQAPAKKASPAAPAAAGQKSSWVKLCEKTPIGTMYKDGKEEQRFSNYCLTQLERLDGNTGMALVTAAVRQRDGEAKQYFMVMVPLGMMVKPGMRAALYPKDAWELLQKGENVDESKLKGLKLEYTLCHAGGCTGEAEASPELINDLKAFGGMVVFAINEKGVAAPFPVPFSGFEKAYTGAPADAEKYIAARQALMQQIAQRQQELAAQQKKKAEQQPAAAAPAPAAKK